MPDKKSLDQLRLEKERAELRLAQEQRRLTRLENRKQYYEKGERAKRIDRHRRPGMNEECEVYEVSVPDEAITDEDEDILNYDDLDDPDAFV